MKYMITAKEGLRSSDVFVKIKRIKKGEFDTILHSCFNGIVAIVESDYNDLKHLYHYDEFEDVIPELKRLTGLEKFTKVLSYNYFDENVKNQLRAVDYNLNDQGIEINLAHTDDAEGFIMNGFHPITTIEELCEDCYMENRFFNEYKIIINNLDKVQELVDSLEDFNVGNVKIYRNGNIKKD